jgi:hypothetical protein
MPWSIWKMYWPTFGLTLTVWWLCSLLDPMHPAVASAIRTMAARLGGGGALDALVWFHAGERLVEA